ncbi:MAG: hypothetical protein COT22_07090, partial [Ignavibacteria bacterium CG08_land_8_20_14_0_20_37_9]
FEQLVASIDYEIVRKIFRVQVGEPRPLVVPSQMVAEKKELEPMAPASANQSSSIDHQPLVKSVVSGKKKIGRNDPCWCGSGKKWKKCHYPEIQ